MNENNGYRPQDEFNQDTQNTKENQSYQVSAQDMEQHLDEMYQPYVSVEPAASQPQVDDQASNAEASSAEQSSTAYQTVYSGTSQEYYPPEFYQQYEQYQAQQEKRRKRQEKKEQRKRTGITRRSAVALVVGCAVLATGFGFGGSVLANQLVGSDGVGNKVLYQSVERTSTSTEGSENGDLTTADVAAMAADSVVEITTESVQTNSMYGNYISSGAGSGVIISKDGYIVTNHHVIDGASKITVTLRNGTSYTGTLVGTDSQTDIAVIKVDANDLTPAVFGDSDKLTVGEEAIAIGNPLGKLGGTVTNGIISALDREITIDGQTMRLLQTNAAINPGNSGGGLFNAAGELIGIVNAKSSGSDIEGLGFAIPINTAKEVIEELISNGYVTGRPSMGISLININDAQTAMSYRVQEFGVYVVKTNVPNSPFVSGDRIISVEGKEVSTYAEVKSIIEEHKVGDTLSVVISRDGSEQTVEVTLQEMNQTSAQN